jgi:hypothetical protein
VETTNKAKKEKSTVNVLWTQSGEEQHKYAKLRVFEPCLLAAPVRGDNPTGSWAKFPRPFGPKPPSKSDRLPGFRKASTLG